MNITKCKECGCTKDAEDRVRHLERQLEEAQGKLDVVEAAWEIFEVAWTDSDVHPRHGPDECDSCDAFWAMLMVIRDAILSKEGNE